MLLEKTVLVIPFIIQILHGDLNNIKGVIQMKRGFLKRSIIFGLALGVIITSAICIPKMEGYAEGVSGNPDPFIRTTLNKVNGSYLWAYANESPVQYTLDNTYPRLVTNGNQITIRFVGYDTTGISNINIKLIKAIEANQLIGWRQPGFPGLISDINFSAQNDVRYDYTYTVSSPGTYVVLTTITAGNGRTSEDVDYFLYGPGTVVGGDFNTRLSRPEGQALYCTLYDLSGKGINMPNTSLYVTKPAPGAPTIQSNNGLSISQDPSFSKRYKVFGYANRSQLQNYSGAYQSYLEVFINTPQPSTTPQPQSTPQPTCTPNKIHFPPYN